MKKYGLFFSAFRHGKRWQAAFALPSAIFLMVILAALAAFLVSVSTHQQSGHAADIQGIRAYQAARAGVEWGAYNFLRNGAACAATTTFNPGSGLAAFTVTVTCAATAPANNEAGTDVTTARIVATACNQPAAVGGTCPNAAPGANYVEREIAVVVGGQP